MALQDELICSFCGRMYPEVVTIVAGPAVYICNDCVDLCNEIVKEFRQRRFIDQTREVVFKELWEGA